MLKTCDLKELVTIKNNAHENTVFAKVESLFNKRQIGHELAIAKQVQSVNFYEFTIRYIPNFSNDASIRWRDKDFNIIKVIDYKNKKKELSLIAEEVV